MRLADVIEFYMLSLAFSVIAAIVCLYVTPILRVLILAALMFAPLTSALVVMKVTGGRSAKDVGIVVRIPELRAIALSLVYPFLVLGVGLAIGAFIAPLDLTMSRLVSELREQAAKVGIPLEALLELYIVQCVIAPFINAILAFGEEAGWRGFLYTRLKEELGRWRAILLTGILWGIWHWPLTLAFGYNYELFGVPPSIMRRVLGIWIFLLFTSGVNLFLVWLRERTGDVSACALAHGAVNAYIGLGCYILLADPLIGFPVGIVPSVASVIVGLPFAHALKQTRVSARAGVST